MLNLHAAHDNGRAARTHLIDEEATLAFGARLAESLSSPLTVYLCGDLGAGKTTLCRGLLRGLGFAGRVKSPTYALVEAYKDSRIPVYHFDFYRFNHAEEFLEGGFDEYFADSGLRLVEWPERAQPYVPGADLEIHLRVVASGGREVELRALSTGGQACIDLLFPAAPT